MNDVQFPTFEEAYQARELCPVCEKPKKAILGTYSHAVTVYFLVECTEENCTIHCKRSAKHSLERGC